MYHDMMMMGRGRICLTFSSINQIIFCSFLIPLKIVDAFSFRNPFTLGEQLFFDENFKVSLLNTPYSSITKTIYPQHQKAHINSNCLMARYGPKEDSDSISSSSNDDSSVLLEQQTEKLRQLVREIIEAKPPESLPSIVTKYLDVLLSIKVDDGVKAIKNIVEEAASSSDEQKEEVEVACEYILNFMEAFVEEARSMDDKNKNLLGRIVRAIAPSTTDGSYSARCREEKLDSVLEEEKENFTPSFLRHVENECRRLANSPAITKDSARLLETIQIIHLRIMEELGKVCYCTSTTLLF